MIKLREEEVQELQEIVFIIQYQKTKNQKNIKHYFWELFCVDVKESRQEKRIWM
jgi:hypothetical protein